MSACLFISGYYSGLYLSELLSFYFTGSSQCCFFFSATGSDFFLNLSPFQFKALEIIIVQLEKCLPEFFVQQKQNSCPSGEYEAVFNIASNITTAMGGCQFNVEMRRMLCQYP